MFRRGRETFAAAGVPNVVPAMVQRPALRSTRVRPDVGAAPPHRGLSQPLNPSLFSSRCERSSNLLAGTASDASLFLWESQVEHGALAGFRIYPNPAPVP